MFYTFYNPARLSVYWLFQLNDSFELSSLEEIEHMEKQRTQAIQSWEITDNSVKCQKCGVGVSLLRTLTKPRNNRHHVALH
jgi:hypothetical protein